MAKLSGLFFVLTVFLSYTSCKQYNQISDLESEKSYLVANNGLLDEKNKELMHEIITLQESSAQLQQQVSRLDNENWRDVVPDIKQKSEELDNELY